VGDVTIQPVQARDEAEFAGMLAQAMARVPRKLTDLPAAPAGVFSPTIPIFYLGRWAGDETAVTRPAFRDLQRQIELQADSQAVKILSAAGFDPSGLAHYFGRADADRARLIEKAISNLTDLRSSRRPCADSNQDTGSCAARDSEASWSSHVVAPRRETVISGGRDRGAQSIGTELFGLRHIKGVPSRNLIWGPSFAVLHKDPYETLPAKVAIES
jgi:predicted Zn-dependent protease